MRLLTGIMFVISLTACAEAQRPSIFDIRGDSPVLVYVHTPAVYEAWWQEIAACENLPLPEQHKDVQYVVVPTRPFTRDADTTQVDAIASSTSNEIYLNYTGVFDRLLVEHEDLHMLLFWKYGTKYTIGTTEQTHPAPYYAQCDMVTTGQQKP